ncbi:MAG: PKD domain-containing protein, partial [Candidatus Thermoplasmatota archaeon]|nr:PKD domain-containing protein [Candidatus Thermoplasmatota archaeon]
MTRKSCIFISLLILLVPLMTFIPNTNFEPARVLIVDHVSSDPQEATRSNFAELPAWDVNFKWRYHRESYVKLDPDGYLNLIDEADYRVTAIEYVTCYNGYRALAYNVTIENGVVKGDGLMQIDTDDPPDGEPDLDVSITINEDDSTIAGFQWYRVSDLAMLQDFRDLHLEVDARYGIFSGTVKIDAENSMQASPGEEDYDFPIYTYDQWSSNFSYHNSLYYKMDVPDWLGNFGVEDEENSSVSDSDVTANYWCNSTTAINHVYGNFDDCYLVDATMKVDDGSGQQMWYYHPDSKNFARWRMENMNLGGLVVKESNNDLMEAHTEVWDVSTSGVTVGPGDMRIIHPGSHVPVICDFPSSQIGFDEDLSNQVYSTQEIGGEFVANVTVPTIDDNTKIDEAVPESQQDVGSHGLLVETDGTYIAKTIKLRQGDLSVEESDVSLSVPDIMAGEPVTISAKVFNLVDTYIGLDINVGFYMDHGTPDKILLGTTTLFGMNNGPGFSRIFNMVWQEPIPGDHSITIIVDSDDHIEEKNEDDNIVSLGPYYINSRPVSDLTVNRSQVLTYEDVLFDARGSSDHEGELASYAWDFDDGDKNNERTVVHNFTDDGIYNVTLTVADSSDVENTAWTEIVVENRDPILVYTLDYEGKDEGANIGAGDEVTFSASESYDIDGNIKTVHWDFGVTGGDSWDEEATYTYQNRDTYTVTLTITDNDNAEASSSFDVSVANKVPVIELKVDKIKVLTYNDINFDASGTKDLDPTGQISSFDWDFGDGSKGTESKIIHQFTDNGIYTVKLTVTDNEGGIVTRTIEIEVTNRPPVLILSPPLSADGTNLISLKKGLNIDLAKSSDIDGATLDYYYDPGEGGSTGWVGESG